MDEQLDWYRYGICVYTWAVGWSIHKKVKRFLGQAGYYHQVTPNYLTRKKGTPDPVQW